MGVPVGPRPPTRSPEPIDIPKISDSGVIELISIQGHRVSVLICNNTFIADVVNAIDFGIYPPQYDFADVTVEDVEWNVPCEINEYEPYAFALTESGASILSLSLFLFLLYI